MKIRKKTYDKILMHLKSIIIGSEFEGHVFAVGGCVRDCIMGYLINDIDLCVDIPNGGILFANWLKDNGYTNGSVVTYENFGTAMFHLTEFPDIELEVVQTRKECYHDSKSRNPETTFGTLKEDWSRRDFTINALYYDISNEVLVDFNNRGISDITNKIIRTCSDNTDVVFNEDPLRILRMVRIASKYGFTIDKNTFNSAKKYTNRLSIISVERIHDEFFKMCDFSYMKNINYINNALSYLWDLNAFDYILPYLNVDTYHRFLFMNKINDIEKYSTKPDQISIETILSALLFDCPDFEEELRELKCSNETIQKVSLLINKAKWFETQYNKSNYVLIEDSVFRKLFFETRDFTTVRQILLISSPDITDFFFDTTEYSSDANLINCLEQDNEFYLKFKLPIDGDFIMKHFKLEPSKKVKELLNAALDYCFVHGPRNCKEKKIVKYLEDLEKNNVVEF